jgi:hypothetical protein
MERFTSWLQVALILQVDESLNSNISVVSFRHFIKNIYLHELFENYIIYYLAYFPYI